MRICPACSSNRVTRQWHCDACGYAAETTDGIPVLAPAMAQSTSHDAEYEYSDLANAETRHFWFIARANLIAWAVRRYFPTAGSFLDVGCGTGGIERAMRRCMPGLSLVAGDVQLSGLRLAKARLSEQEFVQFDIRSLPYESEFSITGAFDVLEHLDDDEAALVQMYKATQPGGGLVVTVPQHQRLWSAVDTFSHHRRRYSRADLVRKIESAGFRLKRTTSFMTFVLPLMAATRLRKRSVADLDPVAELSIGETSNSALGAVCRLESTLIRAGISWPVGGSLLAVAERL
jgi:SAM-dependent methyltransferase